MVRILSRTDVEHILTMKECIEVVRNAFIEFSEGNAITPIRNTIEVREHNGIALYMPAFLPNEESLECKIVTVYSDNPTTHNLPTILSTILLQNPETGEVLAIMDGTYLTAVRTGAVSGVAITHLARKDSKTVGLFGAGVQARTQLWAATNTSKVEQCKIFDINKAAVNSFVKEMSEKLDIQINPVSSNKEAVEGADIILTATTSQTPVFKGEWVAPGTHICGIGSFKPTTRELDTYIVKKAKIVVDSKEACLEEAGDLIIPLQEGAITKDHIYAELGEIASGKKIARETDDEITLFKSVGLAIQDAAAAKLVYEKACERQIGTEIAL
ncbi:MAG: ornithine cyclodeaminase family protein [Candidatus Heimdallarchaeota archaeon]